MIHYAFVYARKAKEGDTGPFLLQLRVTINRKSKYFTTGFKIERSQWHATRRIINHPRKVLMNSVLRDLESKIDDYSLHCQHTGQLNNVNTWFLSKNSQSDIWRYIKYDISLLQEITLIHKP